jgi:hypothetical protein
MVGLFGCDTEETERRRRLFRKRLFASIPSDHDSVARGDAWSRIREPVVIGRARGSGILNQNDRQGIIARDRRSYEDRPQLRRREV